MKRKWIIPIAAILTLPVMIMAQQQIQQMLSNAAPKTANLIIDVKNILGPVNKSWAAFSQGGEEPPPMLTSVIPLMKKLSPQFIRLDHIYDNYSIVSKKDNIIKYDFSRLDQTVDDILATGALPFFSLSYMPPAFSKSGSVIDIPDDWNNWKDLVKTTIEHYSGKNNRNLSNIYYEVWNEPELPQFGDWKISSETDKDYRLLYYYSEKGALEAGNVNNYFLGGSASGSYYPIWVKNLLSYISQNNLRIDFYSWHRYTKKPEEYISDSLNIRNDLSLFPKYKNIPIVLSEWGIDSNNSDLNNGNISAAFTVFAASEFKNNLNLAFAFEVKDGPPGGGKWGLITHESDPINKLSVKPRYRAFLSLSKISNNELQVLGEGTYVKALASSDSQGISIILGNYDISGQNNENVPVTFTDLAPGDYLLKYTYVLNQTSGQYDIATTNGVINKSFIMPANSIIELKLQAMADLATFIPGKSGLPYDQALVLKNNDPLSFIFPQFKLLPQGKIIFSLKPLWDKNGNNSFLIFEAPFAIENGSIDKIFLSRVISSSGSNLVFGIENGQKTDQVSIPIDNWGESKWHDISTGWDQNKIYLTVDNNYNETKIPVQILNGKILKFYPINAALDDLMIENGNEIIVRNFNGTADK